MDIYLKLKNHLNDKEILRKVSRLRNIKLKFAFSLMYLILIIGVVIGILYVLQKYTTKETYYLSKYVFTVIFSLHYLNFNLGIFTGYKVDVKILVQVMFFKVYSLIIKMQYKSVLTKKVKLGNYNSYANLKEFNRTCKYVSKHITQLFEGDYTNLTSLDILLSDYIKKDNIMGIKNLLSFQEELELVEDTLRKIETKNQDTSLYAEFVEAVKNLDYEISDSLTELERKQKFQMEEFRKREKETTRQEAIEIAERLAELKRFR